jgi:hypothetical protein
MSTSARSAWLIAAAQMVLCSALLHAETTPKAEGPGEPFNSFRSLDAQLSVLDRQFTNVKSDGDSIAKIRNLKARRRAYTGLQRSKTARELRSTVAAIQASTHALSTRARVRKSRYGRITFRGLDRRAIAMKKSLAGWTVANTPRQSRTSLQSFSQAMISFVLQFQAVSGGYGALQCRPGDWTCCHPRDTRVRGVAGLNGCKWVCVEKAARCRSGCLGPRTPRATAQRLQSRKSGLR